MYRWYRNKCNYSCYIQTYIPIFPLFTLMTLLLFSIFPPIVQLIFCVLLSAGLKANPVLIFHHVSIPFYILRFIYCTDNLYLFSNIIYLFTLFVFSFVHHHLSCFTKNIVILFKFMLSNICLACLFIKISIL